MVLAAAAPGGIAGTAFSAAADHRSRRVLAAGGALGFAAALAAFAAGTGFAGLVLASFLAGVAATAMVDAAEVALVDLAASDARERAGSEADARERASSERDARERASSEASGGDLRRYLTRGNLLAAVGDLTGPALVVGVALTGASWRVVFAVGAALLAAYAVVLALAPLPPPRRADDEDPPTPRAVVLAVVRDRRVWLVGVASLLLGPFDESFLAFAVALLDEVRGASPATANLVAVAGLSGGLVTFTVLAPRVSDRTDDRALLAGCAAALGLGAVVVGLVPALPVVAAGAFLASVALNLGWLAVQHRTLTLRPGQAGTTKAVVSSIETAGFLLPAAAGAVADGVGLPLAVAGHALVAAALAGVALLDRRR